MFFKHNLYPIVWATLMLFMAFIPESNVPDLELGILPFDKVIHFSQFVILVFLMNVGFIKQHRYIMFRLNTFQYVLYFALPYAIVIEIIHLFLTTRSFDWSDMLANILGCAGGIGLFYLIYRL